MSLQGNGISYQYSKKGRKILDNIHLEIEAGERVGLIAPSGYGKTTLCKVLAGYEQPSTGTVLVDGKPLYTYKGYCPVQLIWQHPEQAVNPRLKMNKVLLEAGKLEQRILDGLGIEENWKNRFPGELSGGELQRFCIARALGEKTRYLLADEISVMLDLITQSQIWNFLIEETQRRKIGILVVSHPSSLLEQVCNRQIDLTHREEEVK